jgi:hypothetical protein
MWYNHGHEVRPLLQHVVNGALMPGKLDDDLLPLTVHVAAIDDSFACHMQHLVTLLKLTHCYRKKETI